MRVVIKIGTSTLAHSTGHLNIKRVEELCKIIADIKNAGNEIILVSSGAIGMGVGKLGLKQRPKDMPTKQAAAAVERHQVHSPGARQRALEELQPLRREVLRPAEAQQRVPRIRLQEEPRAQDPPLRSR